MADLHKSKGKGSSLVLKEAMEKENLASGGDSSPAVPCIAVKSWNGISINDAEVDGPGFGNVFGSSEDFLKDETKDFVKPACELDVTDDVVFGCDEGTDPMLKDEMKGIVKPAFELDSTGSAGPALKEGPDSKIGSSFEKSKADVSTKIYHRSDGFRKSKGSSIALKEATERENVESGRVSSPVVPRIAVKPWNGISINYPRVDNVKFGDLFEDEAKENVKAANKLDNTGDVGFGFGFDEGADLKLKDETKGIVESVFVYTNAGAMVGVSDILCGLSLRNK